MVIAIVANIELGRAEMRSAAIGFIIELECSHTRMHPLHMVHPQLV